MPPSSGNKDSKFFSTTKKGEVHELKSELNSCDKEKIKNAVKKTIAAMTVGKDVSSLFTDVVKNMHTDNIELKKLVYLYIINYARSQPDQAILVVNTFQKDASDSSPLIRALAIRTMGCIRVDRITEHLCVPLSKALKDPDPYVRKTAAVCVAKLFDINAELVEEQGFLDSLRSLISDANPMVVANAVAALAEIADASQKDVLRINGGMLAKLLAAMNECTEWGQVSILDALAKYVPSQKDAEEIVERVGPRLLHANSAVSMSAIKVILNYMEHLDNPKLEKKLLAEKLPPPLITLLGGDKPEIQYVALRNIRLIVQKYPAILSSAVKHFFCKFNDPLYVKMEKLSIMVDLATNKNIDRLLLEFKEYASEIDTSFVQSAVTAIGRVAIKLDKAAEKCLRVLVELIQTNINNVVQVAVIVTKDIFRKYPNQYESVISTLCENLESLDDPNAKASMVWILGEYADRIDNSPELLESFVENFEHEDEQIQQQILTAVVKLFLKRPDSAKDMVTNVLNMCTSNSTNPDLRDRGYIYWRLLSADPAVAQAVVLAKRPPIADHSEKHEPSVLKTLISDMSTLASVYHKPPEYFLKNGKGSVAFTKETVDADSSSDDSSSSEESGSDDESEEEEEEEEKPKKKPAKKSAKVAPPASTPQAAPVADMLDLLNLGSMTPAPASASPAPSPTTPANPLDIDLFGGAAPSAPAAAAKKVVLTSAKGNGLQIACSYSRANGAANMNFRFENHSPSTTLTQFAVKFNANALGVSPNGGIRCAAVAPGGHVETSLPLVLKGEGNVEKGLNVQIAIKSNLGVSYFADLIPAYLFFGGAGALGKKDFLQSWSSLPEANQRSLPIPNRVHQDQAAIKARLAQHNCFYVAGRSVKDRGDALYFSTELKGVVMLVEVTIMGASCQGVVKTANPSLAPCVLEAVRDLLTTS